MGYKTDMERGRKKEERKNTPSSPSAHIHSFQSLTSHTMTKCLCAHTLFSVTQDAYLLHAHIRLVFSFSLPISLPFLYRRTHTYTHHSGVTGAVSWRERVGDLGVITAWLSDSSDDDIQCFELLWPGPAPNTTRQYIFFFYLATMHTCGLDTTATHTAYCTYVQLRVQVLWTGGSEMSENMFAVYFPLLEVNLR